MGAISCEVCMGHDEVLDESSLLIPLLDKHLGILLCRGVKSCMGCIKLLQMWDKFSLQAKNNLQITHADANYEKCSLKQGANESPAGMLLDTGEDSDDSEVMICEDDDDDDVDIICDSDQPQRVLHVSSTCSNQPDTEVVELSDDDEESVPSVSSLESSTCGQDLASSSPQDSPGALTGPLTLEQFSTTERPIYESVENCDTDEDSNTEAAMLSDIDPLLYQLDVKPILPMCTPDIPLEPMYSCNMCSKKFCLQQVLKLHMKSKHKKKILHTKTKRHRTVYYKCTHCDKYLNSRPALEHHLMSHTNDIHTVMEESNNMYPINLCQICCKSFKSEAILEAHMQKVHSVLLSANSDLVESDEVQCPFCYTNCPNLKKMERHISVMHPEPHAMSFVMKKNSNVVCHFCDKHLCSKKMLKFHILNVHYDDLDIKSNKAKVYTCEMCNQIFNSVSMLQKHKKHNHSVGDVSNKSRIDSDSPPKLHVNVECEEPICDKSEGTIVDSPTANKKENTSNVVKYFRCKSCSFICISREVLQDHKAQKHALRRTRQSVNFKCASCLRTFESRALLQSHNKTCHTSVSAAHTSSRNNQVVSNTCKICDHVFRSERVLKSHMTMHTSKDEESKKLNCNPNEKANPKINVDSQKEATKTSSRENTLAMRYKIYESKFKFRNNMYFCNFCMKSQDSLNKIIYHLRSFHLPKNYVAQFQQKEAEKFCCDLCQKEFKSQQDLDAHALCHNSKQNILESPPVTSDKENKCREEILMDLLTSNNFSCTFCCKVLSTMDEVYHHCKILHADRMKRLKKCFLVHCKMCDVQIISMAALVEHIGSKHEQTAVTRGLGKVCKQEEICQLLMSGETGGPTASQANAVQVQTFVCCYCGKPLHSKIAMEYHIKKSHILKRK